ncbi:beta-ketoacyl synthase N-terminal-like domain-containing protein [Campylobacter geochelonis]|uniref:MatE efflux family protein n=1 Tax=Campylobacter geochelonis TaxID=1780362 RepID=A0A128EEY2_9BACT|nr:beta-ketoacyl synthase N-terminal-like domain-containing protein [Campylobacter geochelonis]QKF71818.1 3-oxoacyl-[acp] synthase I [Campylobacter geochelonis]CZE47465.1 MatE efflux family protein [Campylobacter geochelonis]
MSKVYLSQPGVITAAGTSLKETFKSAMSQKTALKKIESFYNDKSFVLAKIYDDLESFSAKTDEKFHTRTNQILLSATTQILPQINRAITKFGRERVGVVIATTTSGVEENLSYFKTLAKTGIWDDKFSLDMNSLSNPAEFLHDFLRLSSACFSVSTACTSGAKALIDAARLIKSGLCDAVVCGGVDSLNTMTVLGFNSLEVLSDEVLNPFSKNRKGTNLGEGAAVFLLSKDEISDISLLGYATNTDAFHITKPSPEAKFQIKAIEDALKMANLKSVDYVNLHATATMANDKMEAKAVFSTLKNTPCSSSKPIIGHTLGAAGAIECALCYEMIEHGNGLLPHLYDGAYDESLAPLNLALKLTNTKPKTALSTSFAFGGDNAVVIIGKNDEI